MYCSDLITLTQDPPSLPVAWYLK